MLVLGEFKKRDFNVYLDKTNIQYKVFNDNSGSI